MEEKNEWTESQNDMKRKKYPEKMSEKEKSFVKEIKKKDITLKLEVLQAARRQVAE